MKDCTAFRLAMLRNGYQPTLNECKRARLTGWPKQTVDEAEVMAWDRSAWPSTGLKVDGDLGVFDVDVADAALVDALAGVLSGMFPELFVRGMVRHAGGPKEAWIVRVDTPFIRRASRKWYQDGGDPDTAVKYQVECFGSLGTRQVGVDGPHSRNSNGDTATSYQFTDGASPATCRRRDLCRLPLSAFDAACDKFDKIAAAAGLVMVKNSDRAAGSRLFELDAGTKIDVQGSGVMTVAELEPLVRPVGLQRRNSSLRCSGSFHDATRTRTDSHLISWGNRGLGVWDAMTDVTWHRRERATPAVFEFLNQLRKGA
jgi:hypothetical protein